MSKPTERQKTICKLIGDQMLYWIATNDITSPTHEGDLKDDLLKLESDGLISGKESDEIENKIKSLLQAIQKMKD